MKVVLITGAGGFLGQYIARHFHAAGWSVVGIGSSPCRSKGPLLFTSYHTLTLPSERLDLLLSEFQPEVIVHCAGQASVPLSFQGPSLDFQHGPVLLFDLLDRVRRSSPASRVVFLSSAAVYGTPRHQPITEDHPLAPASPYGHHKKLCEEICAEFTQFFAVRTACIRIFSAYGPGLRRQVVWDICSKAISEPEVVLQGTGSESRDFIHAQDVAAAVQLVACLAPMQGEVYNVASGQETRIDMVAQYLLERLAPGKRLRTTGVLPPGTPRQWRADIARLRHLGFVPSISFEQGLDEVVSWYQQEVRSECRKKSA